MRTFQNRSFVPLALVGVLLAGPSLPACEPPPGFVDPALPKVGALDGLISRTEETEIDRPLADVMKGAARPLEEVIRPTKDLPGVAGTFRLSSGPYGTVGARRLVCLTDGNIAVEEVLLTESTGDTNRFRYVVWNYTNPRYDDIEYAVGEFVRTQPAPDKTRVNWTYRFKLKKDRDPEVFRKTFLDTVFADWMRSVFGTENKP
jgi:hypothetical protein